MQKATSHEARYHLAEYNDNIIISQHTYAR